MAIGGDIIIKLAADFAQFAEGMTQSTKALGAFGEEAKKTNASIESAIGWLKGLAGTAAVTFVLSKITAYTAAIDQQALAIAKLQKQYKLSAIEVQALQKATDDTGKSFAELVEHASKNPRWLDSIVSQAQSAGTALDEGVIRSISDMDAKSEAATKKINAMFAPFYANTKATALENIANTLSDILDRMDEAAAHPDFWSKMGSLFQPGVIDPDTGLPREANATERQANNMAAAEARLAALRAQYQAAVAANSMFPHELKTLADDIERAEAAINRVRNAAINRAARAGAAITGSTETNIPFVPDLPTTKVFGSRGGGGGRSDVETIDALIARYAEMQKAATAASAAVRADTQTDIKDLALVIEAQQAANEAVAKIEARLGSKVPDEQIERLRQQIFLSKQAQAEQQRDLQYAVAADATQRRLGDGTAAYENALRDLNRQKATGRLFDDAYNRALKQQAEAIDEAARAARRYDDDLGSLSAGFASAAAQYARANDLYTQGGQLFGAINDAMGESLDVLLGRSTKTFGQIAADFANMLAKMALQAALSPVFRIISKGIEAGLSSLLGSGGAPSYESDYAYSQPIYWGRASGGPVYAGSSYMVGERGPERFVPDVAGSIQPAGGGDVYVSINNYTDAKVSARKSKGQDGQNQLDIIVETVEARMANRWSRGQGALARTTEGRYGFQPVGR